MLFPTYGGDVPGGVPMQDLRDCCESFIAKLPLAYKPMCLKCGGKAFITVIADGACVDPPGTVRVGTRVEFVSSPCIHAGMEGMVTPIDPLTASYKPANAAEKEELEKGYASLPMNAVQRWKNIDTLVELRLWLQLQDAKSSKIIESCEYVPCADQLVRFPGATVSLMS